MRKWQLRITQLILLFSDKYGICHEGKTNAGYEELISLTLDAAACGLNNSRIFQSLCDSKSRNLVISSTFCVIDIFSHEVFPFGTSMFTNGSSCVEPKCIKIEELFESGEETPSIVACIRLNDMFSELVRMYQSNIGVGTSQKGLTCVAKLSSAWLRNYGDLVIGLSRFPIFTTYLRIPTDIWKMGWSTESSNVSNLDNITVFPYNIPGIH